MDVTFVLEDGTESCIRVELSDKFQEIKERIKISRNIPVDRQTLLFNGQVLQNEALFIDSHISQLSRVQLLVRPKENEYDLPHWIRRASKLDTQEMQEMLSSIQEPQNMSSTMDASVVLTENPDEIEEFVSSMIDEPPEGPVPQFPPPNKVMFTVQSLDMKRKPLRMEMYVNDNVLRLKKVFIRTKRPRRLKVKDMVVVNKVGDELHDHMSMLECGMLNMSHVYVCRRSERGALVAVDLKHGKMLKVMVVPNGGIQKIPIEVNSLSCLGDLRFELEKFHKHVLPESFGYSFTIKNGLLATETYSFDTLGITEGDTVLINPKQLSFPSS